MARMAGFFRCCAECGEDLLVQRLWTVGITRRSIETLLQLGTGFEKSIAILSCNLQRNGRYWRYFSLRVSVCQRCMVRIHWHCSSVLWRWCSCIGWYKSYVETSKIPVPSVTMLVLVAWTLGAYVCWTDCCSAMHTAIKKKRCNQRHSGSPILMIPTVSPRLFLQRWRYCIRTTTVWVCAVRGGGVRGKTDFLVSERRHDFVKPARTSHRIYLRKFGDVTWPNTIASTLNGIMS